MFVESDSVFFLCWIYQCIYLRLTRFQSQKFRCFCAAHGIPSGKMWDLSKQLVEKNAPSYKKKQKNNIYILTSVWCVLLLDEIHGGVHPPNLHLTSSFKKSFGLGMLRTEINRTVYIFFFPKKNWLLTAGWSTFCGQVGLPPQTVMLSCRSFCLHLVVVSALLPPTAPCNTPPADD